MAVKGRYFVVLLFAALSLIGLGAMLLSGTDESTNSKTVVKTKPVSPRAIEKAPSDTVSKEEQTEEEVLLTDTLISQISDFADYYEEQSRYPVFSVPMMDPEAVEIAEPFEEANVDTPLFDDEGNKLPLSIKAAVDKFEYTVGEAIALRVEVVGLESNQIVTGTANIKQTGGQVMVSSTELSQLGQSPSQLSAVFDTNSVKRTTEAADVIAAITVNIDGDSYSTNVPLRIHGNVSARLENLGVSQIDGAFLKIPLQFSVKQSGYYYVQGYLFEKDTDLPLLALQTEGQMNSGNETLTLKAHHHALKDAGSAGPYTFKVLRAYRSLKAELNELNNVPVAINAGGFTVPSFAFDNYVDTPYEDPEVRRRIEALRELASSTKSQ